MPLAFRLLARALRFRWVTIILTVALFALSVGGMSLVQQQFFPASDRVELIVDWNLPQNSSIAETNRQMAQFEQEALAKTPTSTTGRPMSVKAHHVSSSPLTCRRLMSPSARQSSSPKGLDVRDKVRAELQDYLNRTFTGTDAFVKLLDIGPPVGKPVQYRLSGPDIQHVRELGQQLAGIVGEHRLLSNMVMDWNEPTRVVKVDVLQDKARQLGVSSEDIANAMNSIVEGSTVTQVRDDIYLVNVVARAQLAERGSIETLQNLQLPATNGKAVPLSAIANFRYELEQPTIWRRDRIPTVTVKAAIIGPTQPATIVEQLKPKLEAFEKSLPWGTKVEIGGSVESSADSQAPIVAVVPLMLFAMATILMVQLQSFSRLFLVFAVAPTALIGVVAALLLSTRRWVSSPFSAYWH